ncbi:MAG: hypothetical protein ACO3A4_00270 [Silvanigrellaceae bacterium]
MLNNVRCTKQIQLGAVALIAAVANLFACTKSKTLPAVEQDTLTIDMSMHDFASDGYSILNGGWSGVDFKGHVLPDDRYGKENFIQFEIEPKQIQFFTLDIESRAGILPLATADDSSKTESSLSELIRSDANVNSANALMSFIRLGALAKDYNIGTPKPITLPFTIVTNRDELPYSPKPNAGPEWNQFIRDYCGGFQNPQLGFIWLDGNRKYCLKVWKGPTRQLMRMRALVSLPRSHTSSALDARVSPWITFTRPVTQPNPSPVVEPNPTSTEASKK